MVEEVFHSVREAGERVIRYANRFKPQYPENFLQIIHGCLLEIKITNKNQEHLARLVEWYEFFRLGYLAAILGVPILRDSEMIKMGGKDCILYQTVNHPHPENLPEQQRELVREIKFLFELKTHICSLLKGRRRVEFPREEKASGG